MTSEHTKTTVKQTLFNIAHKIIVLYNSVICFRTYVDTRSVFISHACSTDSTIRNAFIMI